MKIDTQEYVYGIDAAASILGLTNELVKSQADNNELLSNNTESVQIFNRSQLFAIRYNTINEQIKSLQIKYKSIPTFDDRLTVANGSQRHDIAEILTKLEHSVLSRGLRGNQEVRIHHNNQIINISCNIRFYHDNMKVIFFN
ncbi:hypothetical protein [Jeotgalibacillus proteolyticus]|uniref:Uncharacterized protein n=1 Tax=Jeotgalibacillus proteolyticus TaxID=2082395 RepID=A0A2S5GHG0_9BACL|nr:hypothetical protein [Jeotgalibacillus proteolyticus]PPA72293.1 hypothetical protein C4B60_02650 [Jeotgalibacillus proteolyticus]